MTPNPEDAAHLRAARRRARLTVRGLGDAIDVNERTIRRWEKRKWPIPAGVLDLVDSLTHAPIAG